jgi:hypothetical protein
MNPNGPWSGPGGMPQGSGPGSVLVHQESWWMGALHLLPLLLLVVLAGVVVWGRAPPHRSRHAVDGGHGCTDRILSEGSRPR